MFNTLAKYIFNTKEPEKQTPQQNAKASPSKPNNQTNAASSSSNSTVSNNSNSTGVTVSVEEIIQAEKLRTKSHSHKQKASFIETAAKKFSLWTAQQPITRSNSTKKSKVTDIESEYYLKFVVFGAPGVGKTSLVQKYITGGFNPKYQQTIGVDIQTCRLSRKRRTVRKFQYPIRLQVWDVPHGEIAGKHVQKILADVNGIIIMFDITNPKTIEAVDQWRSIIPVSMASNILLCAHKIDKGKHIISPLSLDAYVRDCGYIGWHMTSAKSDASIREAFDFLIDRTLKYLYKKYQGLPLDKVRLFHVKSSNSLHASSEQAAQANSDFFDELSNNEEEGNAIESASKATTSVLPSGVTLLSPASPSSKHSRQHSNISNATQESSSDMEGSSLSIENLNCVFVVENFEQNPFIEPKQENNYQTMRRPMTPNMRNNSKTIGLNLSMEKKPQNIHEKIQLVKSFSEEVKDFYKQIKERFSDYYAFISKTRSEQQSSYLILIRKVLSVCESDEMYYTNSIQSIIHALDQFQTTSPKNITPSSPLLPLHQQPMQSQQQFLEDYQRQVQEEQRKEQDYQVKRTLYAEIKRKFYNETTPQWISLWYSLRTELVLSTVTPETKEGFSNQLPELLSTLSKAQIQQATSPVESITKKETHPLAESESEETTNRFSYLSEQLEVNEDIFRALRTYHKEKILPLQKLSKSSLGSQVEERPASSTVGRGFRFRNTTVVV